MKIEFYYDAADKKCGIVKNKNTICVNMAKHELSVQVKATIVHEIAHALLHMGRKHYTPIEKEYQARMVEYNYCHSHESKRALMYYKKLLKAQNRNLTPLQEEVRRHYKEILRISSFSWQRQLITMKNFFELFVALEWLQKNEVILYEQIQYCINRC